MFVVFLSVGMEHVEHNFTYTYLLCFIIDIYIYIFICLCLNMVKHVFYIHIFCDMYRCNDIYVCICKDVSIYIVCLYFENTHLAIYRHSYSIIVFFYLDRCLF